MTTAERKTNEDGWWCKQKSSILQQRCHWLFLLVETPKREEKTEPSLTYLQLLKSEPHTDHTAQQWLPGNQTLTQKLQKKKLMQMSSWCQNQNTNTELVQEAAFEKNKHDFQPLPLPPKDCTTDQLSASALFRPEDTLWRHRAKAHGTDWLW